MTIVLGMDVHICVSVCVQTTVVVSYLRMTLLYPGASSSRTGCRNKLAYLHINVIAHRTYRLARQGVLYFGLLDINCVLCLHISAILKIRGHALNYLLVASPHLAVLYYKGGLL